MAILTIEESIALPIGVVAFVTYHGPTAYNPETSKPTAIITSITTRGFLKILTSAVDILDMFKL